MCEICLFAGQCTEPDTKGASKYKVESNGRLLSTIRS